MKKKQRIIMILIVAIIVGSVGLLLAINASRQPASMWTAPASDWWLGFDSVEEINQIRQLLAEGNERDLLEFIDGTNNGENIVRNRQDVERFLGMLDEKILPIDSDWTRFDYLYSNSLFIIVYDKDDETELSFIVDIEASFDERIEFAPNYIRTDITDEIAAFANQEKFDATSLRIGNGVQAFSFHRDGDEEDSIQETEEGFDVRVELNVGDGNSVSGRVQFASSLEAAFTLLANAEFARNAW